MDYEKLLDNIYKNVDKKEKGSRFEIPKAEIHEEGNIIIFKNFQVVANKLRREAKMLASFLSKEVAAPVEIIGDKLKIKGKIRRDLLNKKIELFVKKYVLCPQCGKPDTKLFVGKRERYIICEACGARTYVK